VKAAHRPDGAGDLRRRLADPRQVVERLGLARGAKPQSGGVMICCPWHEDSTPSCSVKVAADGTISVCCFGCGETGDALDLIAHVNGLSTDRDFPKILELAAEIAGTTLDDHPAPSAPRPAPPPARDYPPADEVAALWEVARPVVDDVEVSAWLRSRELDPAAIEDRDLARTLPVGVDLPRWAYKRSIGTWIEGGYRCILPLFDELGRLRSVRARRVVTRDDDEAKALPPSGHRLTGLVMACGLGRQLLERGGFPHFWPRGADLQIAVMEGEPDFMKYATSWPDSDLTAPAILGIVAGSWSNAIAARIPDRADVSILAHEDAAGEKYTKLIVDSLRGRVTLRRGTP
jgi:hypothetical protein